VTAVDSAAPPLDRLRRAIVQIIDFAGEITDEDPLQVACFLMSSVGLPRLIAAGWQGPPLFPKSIAAAIGRIARDRDCIVQRLDWALRGLSPRVIG